MTILLQPKCSIGDCQHAALEGMMVCEAHRAAAKDFLKTVETGRLVIFRSLDFEQWGPVRPDDIPAWVTDDPYRLGRMVAGDACQNPDTPDDQHWYTAKRLEEVTPGAAEPEPEMTEFDRAAILQAEEKRARRLRRNVERMQARRQIRVVH